MIKGNEMNKLIENALCNDCGSSDIRRADFDDMVEKYINDIENREGPVDFHDFDADGTPWCYLSQFTGTENVPNAEIPAVLEAVSRFSGVGLVQFSVTSRESNFKDWLECIESVPGHNIIKLNRGEYDVFLCTFPVDREEVSI